MQLRVQMQYKINVLIDIITYLSVTGLEFAPILIYFGPFPSLLGWNVGEVAMLYAITSMSFGLAELFGAGIVHLMRRYDVENLIVYYCGR